MPGCTGRPNEPDPDKHNDQSIHLLQSDLMLCNACDKYNFAIIDSNYHKQDSHTEAQWKAAEVCPL
jgi:hypothetical protein